MGPRKWSFNKDNDDNLFVKNKLGRVVENKTRVSITKYLKVGDKSIWTQEKRI